MARVVWNGAVVAESDDTVVVEGNHYFSPESINRVYYFRRSRMHSLCPWKGIAGYYHIEVDGRRTRNAAWYYRNPLPTAGKIKNRVAFRHGVRIEQ